MPKLDEAKQRLHATIMTDTATAARELSALYTDEGYSVDLRNMAETNFAEHIPEDIGQQACLLALEDSTAASVFHVLNFIEQEPTFQSSSVLQRVRILAGNKSALEIREVAQRIASAEEYQQGRRSTLKPKRPWWRFW